MTHGVSFITLVILKDVKLYMFPRNPYSNQELSVQLIVKCYYGTCYSLEVPENPWRVQELSMQLFMLSVIIEHVIL